MISAKVIADSKNQFGNRLTTIVVTFPRIILAEFNTHRMFSRNSASSRAIPFEKMVESVKNNPFVPIAWQKDHKGMQGIEYLDEMQSDVAKSYWLSAKDRAIEESIDLSKCNVTKQLCNRLLEPFMWHTVIVTASEWENFFNLRCPQYIYPAARDLDKRFRSWKDVVNYTIELNKEHPQLQEITSNIENITGIDRLKQNLGQAEIHMMALAEAMYDAYCESKPKPLKENQWHIPFINIIED